MNTKLVYSLLTVSFLLYSSCSSNRNGAISASGTIETVEVNVASKVGGEVKVLRVDEGSQVKRGDTVAVLDHETLDLQLRQATAGVKVADAQYQLLVKGARKEDISQVEEAVRQAEATLKTAEEDLNRMRELYKLNSVTQKQKDDAETRYTIVLAQYNSAKEGLKKIQQWARPEDFQSAKGRLEQAEAQADVIRKTIADCCITSPTNGIVTHKPIEEGELVGSGATIVTISRLDKVHLMIYVTEIELGKVKLGQEADVRIDTYPEKSFQGKVIYVSPQAEFTPKNVQTKEDRTKLVFAVKIEIENPEGILKPGLPADAVIR
jgi:HlyD family secretion protein